MGRVERWGRLSSGDGRTNLVETKLTPSDSSSGTDGPFPEICDPGDNERTVS